MEIKRIERILLKNQWEVIYIYYILEFKVEDLKYIKDDPLLDDTYRGFV